MVSLQVTKFSPSPIFGPILLLLLSLGTTAHDRLYYTCLEITLLVELLSTLWAQPLHAVLMIGFTTHTLRSDCLLNSLSHWAQTAAACGAHDNLYYIYLEIRLLVKFIATLSTDSCCLQGSWQVVLHIPWDKTACWTPFHTHCTATARCLQGRLYYTYPGCQVVGQVKKVGKSRNFHQKVGKSRNFSAKK